MAEMERSEQVPVPITRWNSNRISTMDAINFDAIGCILQKLQPNFDCVLPQSPGAVAANIIKEIQPIIACQV